MKIESNSKATVPGGWLNTTLGEVLDPSRPRISPTEKPELPFIGMDHVEAHSMKLLGTVPAGNMKSSAVHFQPGDVLYGRLRPYLNKVFRPTFEGLCSAEFIVFPESEGLDNRYLQYFLNSSSFVSFATQLNTGDRPRVKFEQLESYNFPLAPLEQQKRIVAEIEKQFSRLDEAVANLKRVKANLKRYKAAVLKAAVEGRLVETEAELARRKGRDYETGAQLLQRILESRRKQWKGKGKYKEPTEPDTLDFPILPEGWVWASVEAVCEQIVDCPHSTARFQKTGFPCVDTTWMTTEGLVIERARYVDQATYHKRVVRLEPKSGDIVFAREGTIGTAIVIPDRMKPCLGQRVMLLRTLDNFSNKLLMHTLHSEVIKVQYRAQALGSTVPHINVGDVKRFAIPVSPLPEQSRIVSEVERRLSLAREVETQVDINLKRTERLRQSILTKAFSGQLEIKKSDSQYISSNPRSVAIDQA